MFRKAAKTSIDSHMPAKSLELKYTIKLIRELNAEIEEIENEIRAIMDEIHSLILTIPGISYRMDAIIIAEIGDFSHFDSPDKILAYAGMFPYIYQSGQLDNCYSHMKKWGQDICGTPFIMQPDMSAIGMSLLEHILQRNEPKASIIMLPCSTQLRNL